MKNRDNLGKAGGITSNLSESLQRNKKTPRSVVTLGWVSFFTDMASEMIYPLIPLFLVQTLGASPALLGIIDGVAEGVGSGLRWFAGAWSDRAGKRKPFVLTGYSISAVSKPIMGAAAVFGWPLFMAGRCSDRVGKSLRTGARDALIADNTTLEQRGAAFGLHRAMDTAGAVCGPLLGWAILYILPTINLGWIFVVAIVPGQSPPHCLYRPVRRLHRTDPSCLRQSRCPRLQLHERIPCGLPPHRASSRPDFWPVSP